MTKLDLKESIIVMLIKNGTFRENVDIVERCGDKPAILETFDILLQHYTKYYNSLSSISYDFICDLYTKKLGDILFKIDPELYKRAIEKSLNIYPGSYCKMGALDCLIMEVMLLEMEEIELNEDTFNDIDHSYFTLI